MNNSSQTKTLSSIKEFTDNPFVFIVLAGFLAVSARILFSIFPNLLGVVTPYAFIFFSITCVIGAIYYYKERKFIMTALFIFNSFAIILLLFKL
ncbi:hypothetical protein [Lysinibacillus sphaericus]|uniref:hypothetical protein n=1 Tax=Lysinibacillus TaxID=400634 RepID=UPI0005A2A03E|nr:hypothetical protein [Lysinibacillus sphaericus]MBE5085678.1 hypothetical protein [Bacillus thuringiensis]AMO35454.1 hypothetical protein AR327_23470 [Lysinibacillus sphaericus]AMR93113.1 hypothetical protein A1T07_23185 [Lysinibacillus sphaericus]MBG9710704.1 hypothetical protein [Lysinibacillus sphaericus]MBG9730387.1 hypothetical protein [Lysinibacillus sphaericus]